MRPGLGDLPAARAAENHGEGLAVWVCLDPVEELAGIVRVDRLAGAAKDRRIHARGEGDAERVVGRERDDLRVRADELVDVVRIADDDALSTELIRHHPFEHTETGGCRLRGSILEPLDVSPLGVLLVHDPLHPDRDRGHTHLDEVPRVVDHLGKRCCQNDLLAASHRCASSPNGSRNHRSLAIKSNSARQKKSNPLSGDILFRRMWSSRVPGRLGPNRLANAVTRLGATGGPVTDLTETNPTHVGLRYPDGILEPLASDRGLHYDPAPLGLEAAREAVAAHLRRDRLAVDATSVALTASSSDAYGSLFGSPKVHVGHFASLTRGG